MNRRQSVAEHSYYVSVYSVEIAKAIGWTGDLGRLAMIALMHDVDEVVTGDVPSPVKKHTKDIDYDWLNDMMRKRLSETSLWWDYGNRTDEEKAIVKLADLVEGVLYLCDERSQGNNNVGPMEAYMWAQLDKFWHGTFVKTFKLDLGYLAPGGRLWSSIVEAAGMAAKGADPVVA